MGYTYLGHDADVKIKVNDKSIEESFKQAGFSVIDLVVDIESVSQRSVRDIFIKGKDLDSVFYDFINELIYLIDANFFVFSKYQGFDLKKLSKGYELKAQLVGDDYHKYKTKTHVKSMTYNQLSIKKNKKEVIIIFVLDI